MNHFFVPVKTREFPRFCYLFVTVHLVLLKTQNLARGTSIKRACTFLRDSFVGLCLPCSQRATVL